MANVKKIPKKTVTVIEPKKVLIVDKEKHRQKRVAAYCRVSTDSDEQLTSYVTQKKVYTEMIARNPEWEFAGLYADEGISGTRADKRPQFTQMIKDCNAGKIDIIITKSVSRFARNTVECLEYVRMLKAKGISIIFEEQNIDTMKCDSELFLVMYAGFAQSESESMSKNITWSNRKNFADGKVVFRYSQLLGYRKGENGEPEIVPEEAAVVERIFQMFLAGMTLRDISAELQSENITFPDKEFMFTKRMVQNILRNEKYCGDCILQKTVTVDCITKERKINQGEAPMYLVENNHPPIVSREIFNRTQEELSRRNALPAKSTKTALTSSGKYSKYALTDVLICGECGSRYKRCTWARNGKKKIVWRCISRLDYGTKYCTKSPTIEEEPLQRAIVRALNRFNAEDRSTYITLMKATIGDAIGLNGGSDEIDLLERRIDALNKRMISMVNDCVASGDDMENHEDEFKAISEETEQLKRRIEAIRESEAKDESYADRLVQIQETIQQRDMNRDTYDESIVRQMIECIKIYSDNKIRVIFGGGYEIEEEIDV
ncbi:MAG: recombinase family protein [Oscillospiraceae bacterium]|nr:recombinase family protein [Oscillospiraceae bacterium]